MPVFRPQIFRKNMPHFIFKSTTIAGRFTLRLVDKAKVKASPQIVLVPEHLKVIVENRGLTLS